MPQVRANGIDIGYEVRGAGPPLLMLHGATSSGREDFGPQLALFAKAFRCYAPDARGHAATRWDVRAGFSQALLADDALAFAEALGLTTFHLLGFSMGAATALGVAARAPERLRTLALVGISIDREPRASVARRLFDPQRILAHDPAWAAEQAARHDPAQGEGAWQRLLPAIATDVASQPLPGPEALVRIDCPVLVAVGDRDPFVHVDQANRLKRQLRDGRLFVAPDCGHEVMLKRPALFNEALAGFYRATARVATARAERAASPGPAIRAMPAGGGSFTSARTGTPGPTGPDTDWLTEADHD